MQIPEPAGFVVTLKDVWDEMRGMSAEVREFKGQLAAVTAAQDNAGKHRADLESRLRVLEASKAKLYGAAVALGAVAGGGAGWVALVLGRR